MTLRILRLPEDLPTIIVFTRDVYACIAHRKDEIAKSIEGQVSEKLDSVRNLVEQIQSSGTYLVHAEKENCISRLELFEADLTLLDEKSILRQEAVESTRREVER